MDEQTIGGEVQQLGHDVQQLGQTVVNDVKGAFFDAEKACIAALGKAHNLLSGFNLTAEVQTAKGAVEVAILNFAKHLGL